MSKRRKRIQRSKKKHEKIFHRKDILEQKLLEYQVGSPEWKQFKKELEILNEINKTKEANSRNKMAIKRSDGNYAVVNKKYRRKAKHHKDKLTLNNPQPGDMVLCYKTISKKNRDENPTSIKPMLALVINLNDDGETAVIKPLEGERMEIIDYPIILMRPFE